MRHAKSVPSLGFRDSQINSSLVTVNISALPAAEFQHLDQPGEIASDDEFKD